MPPRLDDDVLHRLVDVPAVVEDATHHDTQVALVTAHDLCEGVDVALLRRAHQPGVVVLLLHVIVDRRSNRLGSRGARAPRRRRR